MARVLLSTGEIDLRSDSAAEGPQTVEALEELVRRARDFALASVYAQDVSQEGGLTPRAVDLAAELVWFQLGSGLRHLGVLFKADQPVDVYCDSP